MLRSIVGTETAVERHGYAWGANGPHNPEYAHLRAEAHTADNHCGRGAIDEGQGSKMRSCAHGNSRSTDSMGNPFENQGETTAENFCRTHAKMGSRLVYVFSLVNTAEVSTQLPQWKARLCETTRASSEGPNLTRLRALSQSLVTMCQHMVDIRGKRIRIHRVSYAYRNYIELSPCAQGKTCKQIRASMSSEPRRFTRVRLLAMCGDATCYRRYQVPGIYHPACISMLGIRVLLLYVRVFY